MTAAKAGRRPATGQSRLSARSRASRWGFLSIAISTPSCVPSSGAKTKRQRTPSIRLAGSPGTGGAWVPDRGGDEDIRLLTSIRLQNRMALAMAAADFTMAYLSLRTNLGVLTGHVIQAALRLFGVPDFRFYALAAGIKTHLFGQKRGLYGVFSARDPETGQQLLFIHNIWENFSQ